MRIPKLAACVIAASTVCATVDAAAQTNDITPGTLLRVTHRCSATTPLEKSSLCTTPLASPLVGTFQGMSSDNQLRIGDDTLNAVLIPTSVLLSVEAKRPTSFGVARGALLGLLAGAALTAVTVGALVSGEDMEGGGGALDLVILTPLVGGIALGGYIGSRPKWHRVPLTDLQH